MIAGNLGVPQMQVAAAIAAARERMASKTPKQGTGRIAAPGGGGLMPMARFIQQEAVFLGHLLRGAGELPADARHAWAATTLGRSGRHRQQL
ncbi:hypothetical protein [Mangrovicoccus sp. HB161399]|uniref:hypothetical protein n=1 Tax=Mangrovicoccus sp. HB161399 TaxID=2720392 RepID=UPI001551AA71|nr:hypothetical protein [Mangrovicoccus sp. HB161399]